MGHNVILVALSLVLQLPLALGVALLLNRPLRGRGSSALIFFAPYVLSEADHRDLFLQILQPDGLVDAMLRGGRPRRARPALARRPRLVFYTLFVVITWKYIGFAIILFLAGLQGIPPELNEAAAMDGATAGRRCATSRSRCSGRRSASGRSSSIIGSIQLFDLVWIMTLGGPADASSTMADLHDRPGLPEPAHRLRDLGRRDPLLHLLRLLDPLPALRPAPRHVGRGRARMAG